MSKQQITLESLDKRFDDVLAVMSQFANDVNTRFEKADEWQKSVDMKLIKLDSGLKSVQSDVDTLKTSFDRLLNTVDGFISRIDRYETELLARDHEIERIKRWIQELAEKTGTKLTA